jgi:hypothetical protein
MVITKFIETLIINFSHVLHGGSNEKYFFKE